MKKVLEVIKESIINLFAVIASGIFAPSLTIFKYFRLPNSIINAAPSGGTLGNTKMLGDRGVFF